MKHALFLLAAAVMMTSACNNKKTSANDTVHNTEQAGMSDNQLATSSYQKDNTYSQVKIEVEWPKGSAESMVDVRKTLLAILHDTGKDMEMDFDKCKGESESLDSAVNFYGAQLSTQLGTMAKNDERTRRETMEEGNYANSEPLCYATDIKIKRAMETDRYIAFNKTIYVFLGGAHGSTLSNTITINKKTGAVFTSFLTSDAEKSLQQTIRHGLVAYFAEDDSHITESTLNDYLFLESKEIPLPAGAPGPTEKGLVFTYAQYEIAPYAAGMPSFTISYEELMPYLTPEAKELLGL